MDQNSLHKPTCNIRIKAYVIMRKDQKTFCIKLYNDKEHSKLTLPQSMFMEIIDNLQLKPFREQRLGLSSTITYFYNPKTTK